MQKTIGRCWYPVRKRLEKIQIHGGVWRLRWYDVVLWRIFSIDVYSVHRLLFNVHCSIRLLLLHFEKYIFRQLRPLRWSLSIPVSRIRAAINHKSHQMRDGNSEYMVATSNRAISQTVKIYYRSCWSLWFRERWLGMGCHHQVFIAIFGGYSPTKS